MELRCKKCQKKLAVLKKCDIIEVEIKCPKCKSINNFLFVKESVKNAE